MTRRDATDYEGALRLARGIVHRVELGDPIQPMHSEEQLARALIGLASSRSEIGEPDAYLVEYRETLINGSKKRCTQASLEPREPTIFRNEEPEVEARELLKVTPLYASRSATAGFAEAITASVMNASPAARLEACAPFNAAPQATGTGAADASEKQEPAAAAPLSQSDKQYRTWRDDPPQKSTWVWAKYDAEELARLYLTCKRGCCVYSDMGTMILPVLWRPATTAEGEAESERWKSMKHLDVGDLMDAVAPDTSRSSVATNEEEGVEWLRKFLNCAAFSPPASEIQKAQNVVTDLLSALGTSRSCTRERDQRVQELEARLSAIATNDELRNARESRDRWQAEAERIAVLLRAAKCPNSNCERGEIATYDKNGDLDVEPCQWCHERQLYVPEGSR